ncbi:MAG: hypothetical protein ACR2FN_01865 [Chitinophagaceae bacterium]
MKGKINYAVVLLLSISIIFGSCSVYGKSSKRNCGCPAHRGIVG